MMMMVMVMTMMTMMGMTSVLNGAGDSDQAVANEMMLHPMLLRLHGSAHFDQFASDLLDQAMREVVMVRGCKTMAQFADFLLARGDVTTKNASLGIRKHAVSSAIARLALRAARTNQLAGWQEYEIGTATGVTL